MQTTIKEGKIINNKLEIELTSLKRYDIYLQNCKRVEFQKKKNPDKGKFGG
jgi:hypothetical protein